MYVSWHDNTSLFSLRMFLLQHYNNTQGHHNKTLHTACVPSFIPLVSAVLNRMSTYDYIITRRRKQASQQDIEMGFPQSSDSNGNAGQVRSLFHYSSLALVINQPGFLEELGILGKLLEYCDPNSNSCMQTIFFQSHSYEFGTSETTQSCILRIDMLILLFFRIICKWSPPWIVMRCCQTVSGR